MLPIIRPKLRDGTLTYWQVARDAGMIECQTWQKCRTHRFLFPTPRLQ